MHSIRHFFLVAAASLLLITVSYAQPLHVTTTRQHPAHRDSEAYVVRYSDEQWEYSETALIICDVWDSHHCVNAVRRVQQLAPRIDAMAVALREHGATIIHAPSDCMPQYADHPARKRALSAPKATNLPNDISSWCDRIPSEEASAYPIDQSDGGEDDTASEHEQWAQHLSSIGRNPKLPWVQQIPTLKIDSDRDFITDSGNEVWNILEDRKIKHVLICGVHTNMCVLGRPFGLRQLTSHGKHAVLVKDLTDTMYNPARWPYVNHFSGTDLVIDHVERYVAPTTTSDCILQGSTNAPTDYQRPFRFSYDKRPTIAMLIDEDEYRTASTLPKFADSQLRDEFRIEVFQDFASSAAPTSLQSIRDADVLLLSMRRKSLPPKEMEHIRAFVRSGKPVIGIRTASHAFTVKSSKPIKPASEALVEWTDFDAEVFGGNYSNHFGNELHPTIYSDQLSFIPFVSRGSLYQVTPLQPGTRVLGFGKIEGQMEQPIAWTFVRADSGLSFYTSLGHPSDFEEPHFRWMLTNAIRNAAGLDSRTLEHVKRRDEQYEGGRGKQR